MQTSSSARAVLLLLLGCSILLHAQSHVLYLPAPEKPMTVQDVIKLWKAGYSDDLIIEQIKEAAALQPDDRPVAATEDGEGQRAGRKVHD